jgi:hypothetical protein
MRFAAVTMRVPAIERQRGSHEEQAKDAKPLQEQKATVDIKEHSAAEEQPQ